MTAESAMVKSSLEQLLEAHSSSTDLSCIDDVVVSYVCGVVEDIATGDEEEVDANEMKNVMSAYIPAFEHIPENEVESWVKMVKKALDEKNKGKVNKDLTLDSLVSSFPVTAQKHRSTSMSESSERSHKLSETSDSSEDVTKIIKEDDQYAEALAVLLELFPGTCTLEAQHCLSSSGGNLEESTSLLLERQEQGLSIKVAPIPKILPKGSKIGDKEVRNSILNKYGFIDHEDDHKEHRPVAPKWEGKKMVRYRDNKVVSLKGERYTEIKKEESDELKKTYVNIKPAKQYRFH